MDVLNSNVIEQTSIFNDLNSLDAIRRQAKVDESGAIKKAAKEFEAFFMNMMLKSMRQAGEVIGDDSPFSSQQEKMFTGMLDEQMSVELSRKSHFGIADMMMRQLDPSHQSSGKNDFNELIRRNKHYEYAQPVPVETSTIGKPVQPAEINMMLLESVARKSKFNEALNVSQGKVKFIDVNESQPRLSLQAIEPIASETVKPEKRSLFARATDFISTLLPLAEQAAKKLSLDPKVLLAQAALETGWGKFVMHDESGKPGYNLFGIKAGSSWGGEEIRIDTLEVENQQLKKINASFRKYDSFADSFDDYVDFISNNSRYQKATEAVSNSEEYLQELQSSGYATDPQYAEKILRIYQSQKIQGAEFEEVSANKTEIEQATDSLSSHAPE